MVRFDLHRLSGVLAVDLQHGLLEHLPTRVVAPLLPPEQAGKPVRDLNPSLDIEGVLHILATHQLTAVPRRERGPATVTMDAGDDVILRAISILLLTGV